MFHYYTKLGAKLVEPVLLMHKFVPWTHIIIFGSERTRSTPLDRELLFCAFHSVWVHFGLYHYWTKHDAKWAEMLELMHKFVAWNRIGILRNERTRSTQLDPKLMCLVHFVVFGCILDCFVTAQNSVQNGLNWCKSSCFEVVSEFFATNHSIHSIGF